jgi:UDP-N-acetylglucosamine transferase subunit ALG13
MIFVTFGNGPLDFSRLAKEIDKITPELGESVFVQSGHTEYHFQFAKSEKFLDSKRMQALLAEASVVVSHGGWGTISECLNKNKRLVAVPRRHGSECNHSQDELVGVLENRGCLIAVYQICNLKTAIVRAHNFIPQPLERGNASATINEFLYANFPKK